MLLSGNEVVAAGADVVAGAVVMAAVVGTSVVTAAVVGTSVVMVVLVGGGVDVGAGDGNGVVLVGGGVEIGRKNKSVALDSVLPAVDMASMRVKKITNEMQSLGWVWSPCTTPNDPPAKTAVFPTHVAARALRATLSCAVDQVAEDIL